MPLGGAWGFSFFIFIKNGITIQMINVSNNWALYPDEEKMIVEFKDGSVVSIGLQSNNIKIVTYGSDNDLALMCRKDKSPDFVSLKAHIWNHINNKLGGVLE